MERSYSRSRKPCRFHFTPSLRCNKGDRCTFSHDARDSRSGGGSPNTGKSKKQTPENFPEEERLCPWYITGSCHAGNRCRHIHDETARARFQRLGEEGCRALQNTNPPDPVNFDFHCWVCDRKVVAADQIFRAWKNCIWLAQGAEVGDIWVEDDTYYNSYKKVYCQRVFCICGWFIGSSHIDYCDSETGELLSFKLEVIARSSNNAPNRIGLRSRPVWDVSEDSEDPEELHPVDWQSDKRDLEKQLYEELRIGEVGISEDEKSYQKILKLVRDGETQTLEKNMELQKSEADLKSYLREVEEKCATLSEELDNTKERASQKLREKKGEMEYLRGVVDILKEQMANMTSEQSETMAKDLKEMEAKLESLQLEKEQLEEELDAKTLCMICCDERIDCAMLPCAHANFCTGCATTWKAQKGTCPSCRSRIDSIQHLYV